jgi:hypothetical protein
MHLCDANYFNTNVTHFTRMEKGASTHLYVMVISVEIHLPQSPQFTYFEE